MRKATGILLEPPCPDPGDPGVVELLDLLMEAAGAPWIAVELERPALNECRHYTAGGVGDAAQLLEVESPGLFHLRIRLPATVSPPPVLERLAARLFERFLESRWLQRLVRLFEGALDKASSSILLFDPQGQIVYANPPADAMLSRQTEDELTVLEPGGAVRPLLAVLVAWTEELLRSRSEHPGMSTVVTLSDGTALACELVRIDDEAAALHGVVVLLQPLAMVPDACLSLIAATYRLTPREHELLHHLAGGLGTAEVAREMGISLHTVRDHIKNLYRKTGTRSRSELVGLLSHPGALILNR